MPPFRASCVEVGPDLGLACVEVVQRQRFGRVLRLRLVNGKLVGMETKQAHAMKVEEDEPAPRGGRCGRSLWVKTQAPLRRLLPSS